MKIRVWPNGVTQRIDEHEGKDPYPWMSDDFIIRNTEECILCGDVLQPEYDEPFASCSCGTQEWYK